jgi:hypothetical protein
MVKTNAKRLVAVLMAATMVVGSSVTVFATADNGEGTYEGNDVSFGVATVLTVPTTPATGFSYIGDPNGLIRESGSSHYEKATWADTAKGVFFKTSGDSTNGYAYSEKSAALEVVNKNAAPIIVSAKIKKKAGDTGTVIFTNDATFGAGAEGTGTLSTDKSIYIAVTDGTNTKAIAAGGAEVELPIAVSGKVGNYELVWDATLNSNQGGYKYALKSGITTDDASKWNKTSFYVTGFLNENADWSGTGITFPAITVTWDVTAGAAPIKIKSGKAAEGSLTYAPETATTISKVKLGDAELDATVIGRTNQSGTTPGKISMTAANATNLYSAIKAQADGLTLTVEYADGHTEPVVLFAK